ncbi:DUF2848 domain-containing protein [Allobacillus sp. SKP2-8]|uniref:DUF2848 family protein n=1 Tax=unclassified Allobacillus TaxID=2628859 RepID=UPI001181D138|nr:DUF2848 family protein [Allobacillus sp. SKP2-8]TSJ67883.1 DUF2848 domain-containing protein [Allobacillus sp. SKP2-8]
MSKTTYQLDVAGETKELAIHKAFCIGYTGRNKENTYAHIKELAEIGIPEPKEVPMLYPVSGNTIFQNQAMEVVGKKTSGEAEVVLIFGDSSEDVYVTVGSDHTDRGLETVDINKSKQVCGKPFATKAWKLRDVLDHWDELELTSQVYVDGEWVDYQQDSLKAIMPYEEIIQYIEKVEAPKKNSIFFSGTVPLKDGFKYGTAFRMTFRDPVNNDEITSEYDIINIERE